MIVTCRECSNTLSSTAAACPVCGALTISRLTNAVLRLTVAVAIVGFVLALLVGSCAAFVAMLVGVLAG